MIRRLLRSSGVQVLALLLILLGGAASEELARLLDEWAFLSPLRRLGLLMVLVGAVMFWLSRRQVDASLRAFSLKTPHERRRHANRGLVVFVSLYRPMASGRAVGLTEEGRLAAAQARDYMTLDLEHSNLGPVLHALQSHASRLQHCWLLGTIGTGRSPGSVDFEEVLVSWLRGCGATCRFHYGPDYGVSLEDDGSVAVKTYELIRKVYREAKELGIGAEEMITDFTGCPRSMSVGAILACMSVDRNIQLIGTRYDGAGNPIGEPFPIVFSFEARIPPAA